MGSQNNLLHTKGLIIGYREGKGQIKQIAGPLDLEMFAGELICLLGPNGCGKSTLLKTIAGLQSPLKGTVEIENKKISKLSAADIALKISLVLTDNVRSGNLDVYSLVALGRYPHTGWLGVLSKKDKEIIDHAIQSTDTAPFLNRKVDSLSDGECQKVMLARAIAQDTPLIILDEPTAHLDLPSRIQLMRLLHQLAKETNKAILISTHELDLALQVADKIWLMQAGGELRGGIPEDLVLNGSFQHAFDKEGIHFDPLTGSFNIHPAGKRTIKVSGDGAAAFWTKRAVIRNGFSITEGDSDILVSVVQDQEIIFWLLNNGSQVIKYTDLADMLLALS